MAATGGAVNTAGRAKREQSVNGLRERIRSAGGLVFLNAQKLNAAETTNLRKAVRGGDASLTVVKNRLMRIACERESIPDLKDWLKQNTAVAFLGSDPVAGVKAVDGFAAEHDKLIVKGGLIEGKPVGASELKALASLPGRFELLTKTAVVMKAPLTRGARSMKGVFVKMVLLMKEAAKKAPAA